MHTVEFLRECFEMDEERGALTWKTRPRDHFNTDAWWRSWNTIYAGKKAGCLIQGYIVIKINNKPMGAHNVCWAIFHGRFPLNLLDHIDGDTANNSPSNLRDCTRAENCRNLRSKSSTGLKGAVRSGKKFASSIRLNGKRIHLGTFATAEDAHDAYCTAAKKYHGEFASFDVRKISQVIPTGAPK